MSELLSSGHTAASEGARGMNLGRGACEPAGSPVRHSDRCFPTNRWCHQTAHPAWPPQWIAKQVISFLKAMTLDNRGVREEVLKGWWRG